MRRWFKRRRSRVVALAGVLVIAIAITGFHAHGHSHGALRVIGADGTVQEAGEWRLGARQAEPVVVRAGEVSFELEAGDDLVHTFVVARDDGAGDPLAGGQIVGEVKALPPGSTERLTFELKPGRYVLYCDVTGHADGGMYYSITVE